MKTAFLTALYDEPEADTTFKCLELTITSNSKKKKIKFDSGDPILDFYNYKKWMMQNSEKEGIFVISCSSSIDHFYMDSKKYYEKVVVFNEDYSDGKIMNWTEAEKTGHNIDTLITCCVNKKLKTWKQLKNYINENDNSRKSA